MRAATLALFLASCVALLHTASASCDLPSCRVIAGQEMRCQDLDAWFEYYRHPSNKHLYVQCSASGPQVMSCAPGTAWSPDSQVCVFENLVPDCGSSADEEPATAA